MKSENKILAIVGIVLSILGPIISVVVFIIGMGINLAEMQRF